MGLTLFCKKRGSRNLTTFAKQPTTATILVFWCTKSLIACNNSHIMLLSAPPLFMFDCSLLSLSLLLQMVHLSSHHQDVTVCTHHIHQGRKFVSPYCLLFNYRSPIIHAQHYIFNQFTVAIQILIKRLINADTARFSLKSITTQNRSKTCKNQLF